MRGSPAPNRPAMPKGVELFGDLVLDFLPLHAEGRVGEHVVELLALRCPSLLNELPSTMRAGFCPLISMSERQMAYDSALTSWPNKATVAWGFSRGDVFLGRGKHPAGPAGRVEDVEDLAGLVKRFRVRREQQVDHQLDDLAGREVLPGRLVGDLRELPDEFLEDVAHLVVVDRVGLRSMSAKRWTTL